MFDIRGWLFHRDGFGRALLCTIAAALTGISLDYGADVIDEVEGLLVANVHAKTAAGALIDIDLWPLVTGFSQWFHLLDEKQNPRNNPSRPSCASSNAGDHPPTRTHDT
jgi:hypothetical protein